MTGRRCSDSLGNPTAPYRFDRDAAAERLAVEAEVHLACGHPHRLNDECVVPADSPRGRLNRALYSTSTDPARALDRLAAVEELQKLLKDQEHQAVLGARMAGCSWIEMGEAIGWTRRRAHARWGEMVRRFEAGGLLRAEELPAPAPPIDAAAAEKWPAMAWCRWCGHRIVVNADGDWWVHHTILDGAGQGYVHIAECPGPEPWPVSED
jgi:hypothetical protein